MYELKKIQDFYYNNLNHSEHGETQQLFLASLSVLAVKSLSAVNLSRKGRKKYPGPCKHSECRLFFTFKP